MNLGPSVFHHRPGILTDRRHRVCLLDCCFPGGTLARSPLILSRHIARTPSTSELFLATNAPFLIIEKFLLLWGTVRQKVEAFTIEFLRSPFCLILAISFVALCSISQPKGCHLFAVAPANKGFNFNRPLRHAEFSTGSRRVFHWITQGFCCVTQA